MNSFLTERKTMESFYLRVNLLLIFLISSSYSLSVYEWFDWSRDTVQSSAVQAKDGVPLIPVPFEELSLEEKFLQEAQKYSSIQLSQLDSCQHKLIIKIQTSCAGITEEDLAKLSVQLLNCQSEIEDRKLYPCTDKMSLKECTTDMDSNTWNAYHLMNNRARAICYAARQQQFKALSEMTVNKLMTTAHKQLQSMDQLQEVQKQLEDVATTTLTTMTDGQKEMIEQQGVLRIAQDNIKDAIIHNFNQLKKEKALITAGHKELSQMTKELGDKLDSAQIQLQDQIVRSTDNHQQIINELEVIAFRADRIWHRIDESTKQLLHQQKITAVRYEETLNNLERINITVSYLLDLLENTRSELDFRLRWITDIVGGTGEQLDHTISLLQHTAYLVLGMIVAVFLQTSVLTRLTLLCLVPANVILMYKLDSSYDVLNFTSLTICIVFIMLGEWMFNFLRAHPLCRRLWHRHLKNTDESSLIEDSYKEVQLAENSTSVNYIMDAIGTSNNIVQYVDNQSSRSSSVYTSCRNESVTSVESESSEEDEGFSSSMLYKKTNGYNSFRQRILASRSSTPIETLSRSGTPNRAECKALCRDGHHCRITISTNEEHCFRHKHLYST